MWKGRAQASTERRRHERRRASVRQGPHDENFPVASFLIAPRHRPPVLAFYRFVRFADDIADHATAAPDEKLRLLEEMRASLVGESDASPEGVALARPCWRNAG